MAVYKRELIKERPQQLVRLRSTRPPARSAARPNGRAGCHRPPDARGRRRHPCFESHLSASEPRHLVPGHKRAGVGRTFSHLSVTTWYVSSTSVSDKIAGALGRFFFSGLRPSHSALSSVLLRSGYADDDPYVPAGREPNKETRVQTVVRVADGLLTALRLPGCFDAARHEFDPDKIRTAQAAFRRAGWLCPMAAC